MKKYTEAVRVSEINDLRVCAQRGLPFPGPFCRLTGLFREKNTQGKHCVVENAITKGRGNSARVARQTKARRFH